MDTSFDGLPARGRRLRSIFDGLPAAAPLSLDDLEVLMRTDTERRILDVLDRVFASQHEPQVPEPAAPS